MFKKRFSFLLVIIFTLCACTTFNVPADYELSASDDHGVAIFSLTTDQVLENFVLNYRELSSEKKGEVTLKTYENPLDWHNGVKGRLIVVELIAGSYEFYDWGGWGVGPFAMELNSAEHFSVPFKVSPRAAKYFGNIHISVYGDKYIFSISDKSDRDLRLFHKRYKNIREVDNDILDVDQALGFEEARN